MINKLTAAPVVKKALAVMPAPAYTDFINIIIAEELNDNEKNVAIRHEQAHIWCEHGRRGYNKENDLWKIACELEIARNIYTDEDISVIERPRSRLSGGYLPQSIESLPIDIYIAEDIYDWLKNNPDKMPKQQKMCSCELQKNDQDTDGAIMNQPKEIIKKTKDALESLTAQKQMQEDLTSKLKSIKYKQPSLADELDAILRHRIVRERSWRRPSRHQYDINVMNKGNYSFRKKPLIEIFVDRSGSFDDAKTAIAQSALKKILAKYNVQLRADVFFFGNDKLSDVDINGGGNTPYHLIISHLNNTQPKIAIIITDDDAAGPFNCALPSNIEILCLPVGASSTKFSSATGGKDVNY